MNIERGSVVDASYAPLDASTDKEKLFSTSPQPPQPATIKERVKSFFTVHPSHRAEFLSLVLCGFFFVNTVTAELISGKLFIIGPFIVSIGSIMWPCVFITTDVTNEYFGKLMVRRLSFLMAVFLGYIYALLIITIRIPAADFSPVTQKDYQNVFGQSNWIIIGSLIAFLVGQLVDISVYHFMRTRTRGKHLWLRSTGSTVVSQLVDTFIVSAVAFLLPGKITFKEFLSLAGVSYLYKLIIAIIMTPAIYGVHHLLDTYFLGPECAAELIARAAALGPKVGLGPDGALGPDGKIQAEDSQEVAQELQLRQRGPSDELGPSESD